jgi:hypothetical protein
MDTLKTIAAAIAALFTWKSKKLDVDNSPAMQARAQGQTDQEIKDAAAKDLATGNLEQIRKDLAE